MTEPDHSAEHHTRDFQLPEVSEAVIRNFRDNLPDFEVLYDQLRQANQKVAEYVRDRAEQLAPGNIKVKEALARLALETHGIFTAQTEVDALEKSLPQNTPEQSQF